MKHKAEKILNEIEQAQKEIRAKEYKSAIVLYLAKLKNKLIR